METCKIVRAFEAMDLILWCDHSNEISLAALSHGTICFAEFEKSKFRIFLEFLLWPAPLGAKGVKNVVLFFGMQLSNVCQSLHQ